MSSNENYNKSSYARSRNEYSRRPMQTQRLEQQPTNNNSGLLGTAIELKERERYDEGKFVPLWKQEARNEKGGRRFHGAFTGGFSAGYFNSVGTKEGWTPSTVTDSKQLRNKTFRPEDFMDEEDLLDIKNNQEAVAIEPDRYQMDLDSRRKALRQLPNAVGGATNALLDLFLEPALEKVGSKILKSMGWKPGQGIGPPQPITNLQAAYGSKDDTVHYLGSQPKYLPVKDVPLIRYGVKSDLKGLNLVQDGASIQADQTKALLDTYSLQPNAKGNDTWKDTEYDPYHDSSNENRYSNVLVEEEEDDRIVFKKKKRRPPPPSSTFLPPLKPTSSSVPNLTFKREKCFDGRIPLKGFELVVQPFLEQWLEPPEVPDDFVPNPPFTDTFLPNQKVPQLTPAIRRNMVELTPSEESNSKSVFEYLSQQAKLRIEKFAKHQGQPQLQANPEDVDLVLHHAMLDQISARAALEGFIPFPHDLAKRQRYLQFLHFFAKNSTLPPAWKSGTLDRQKVQELQEFQQSAQMFRPLSNLMANRFTPATNPTHSVPTKEVHEFGPEIFGPMNRQVEGFKPARLLCRRFQIPEPKVDGEEGTEDKGQGQGQVENYQRTSTLGAKQPLDPQSYLVGLSQLEPKVPGGEEVKEHSVPELIPRPEDSLFQAIFGDPEDVLGRY